MAKRPARKIRMSKALIEERKLKFQDEEQKKACLDVFRKTYEALVKTISKTFPDLQRVVKHYRELCDQNPVPWDSFCREWYEEFSEVRSLLQYRKRTIFHELIQNKKKKTAGCVCVSRWKDGCVRPTSSVTDILPLAGLYKSGRLSEKSIKYLWLYLDRLWAKSYEFVRLYAKDVIEDKKDIEPPSDELNDNNPLLNAEMYKTVMKQMKHFYDQIPSGMSHRVRDMLSKYGEKMKRGDTKLEDIDFRQVSKELLSTLDKEGLKDIMEGMLRNMMSATTENTTGNCWNKAQSSGEGECSSNEKDPVVF